MLTVNELGVLDLFIIPPALLSLQYGWDMFMEAIVPMSRTHIARLAHEDWEEDNAR